MSEKCAQRESNSALVVHRKQPKIFPKGVHAEMFLFHLFV